MSDDANVAAAASRSAFVVNAAGLVFGTALCLIAIFFATQISITLGFTLFNEQGLAVILALSLCLIFIRMPARRGAKRDEIPWYDLVAAGLGLGMGLYLAYRYPTLIEQTFYLKTEEFIIGIVLVPLSIEALRRTAGWSFTAIVLAFLGYALLGDLVPGKLQGRSQDLYSLVAHVFHVRFAGRTNVTAVLR